MNAIYAVLRNILGQQWMETLCTVRMKAAYSLLMSLVHTVSLKGDCGVQ